jgi:hypothetical protein
MIDTSEIRRKNLRYLVGLAVDRKTFCDSDRAVEKKLSYNYVGQLMTGSRGIGKKTARKIEFVCNKSIGWLDLPHLDLWDIGLDEKIALESQLTNSTDEQVILELAQQAGIELPQLKKSIEDVHSLSEAEQVKLQDTLDARQRARVMAVNDGNAGYTEAPYDPNQLLARFNLLNPEKKQELLNYLAFIESTE